MKSGIFSAAAANGRNLAVACLAVVPGLLFHASPVLAAACGDNVEGERVACACGDTVVSDTVLWATDPVVSEPCPRDGLVIQAPAGSDGVTLDLGGQSIVGRGKGAGVRVARGGNLGAVLVGGEEGRGQIARFRTGVQAHGRNALREIRGVDLVANLDDGLQARSSGAKVADVRADANGRDGVRLSGHGVDVSSVTANSNNDDGLQVRGAGARVSASTSGNAGNGAVVSGRGNRVEALESSGNGGAGILLTGEGHVLGESKMDDNARGAVSGREGALR